MPTHQRIRRDYGVEFKQGFASHCLGLARQKRALSVGESDPLSSQALFEQAILSLEKFDDEQLMAMDPAGHHHQQKRQQRWHRAHVSFYRRRLVRNFGHHAGEVLGKTAERHTAAEFVAFLIDIVVNQPRQRDPRHCRQPLGA